MTPTLKEFLSVKDNWKLKISERLQTAINKSEELEKVVCDIINSLALFYPTPIDENKNIQPIWNCFYSLQDEVDKRIVRQILDETEPLTSSKE